MKKITSLFTLLLLAMCSIGASAETATLTYDNIEVYKNGNKVTPGSDYSYNHQVRSTSSPLITVTIGSGDVVYKTDKFCFGNNNKTYTLSIADGYVITGFTINYTTGSGVKFTSNGVTSDDDGALSVANLYTASTTFYATWGSAGTSSSWQNYSVSSIVVNYTSGNDAIETGNYYIYNNGAGKYLSANSKSYQLVNQSNLSGNVGQWYIQNLGRGSDGNIKYKIKFKGSNYYFGGYGPQAALNTNAAENRISLRENGAYYTLSAHVNNTVEIGNFNAIQWTGSGANLNRSGGDINSASFGANSQWILTRIYTYNIIITGTDNASAGVQYNGNSYSDGDSFETTTLLSDEDFTANTVAGYTPIVKVLGYTVTVTYIEDIDFTDLYVNNINTSVTTTSDPIIEGQWYVLTQLRGGESPAYDAGSGSEMLRAASNVTSNTVLTTNTPASNISQYLLRFISTGISNCYYIQYGTGNLWEDATSHGQSTSIKTTSTPSSIGAYLVYNATQSADNSTGWALNATADGTTYGKRVNNNGAGSNIVTWNDGQATSGTNEVWKLYPVELGAHIDEVTLDVVITDGNESQTFSNVTLPIGNYILATDYVSNINSQFFTYTSHEVVNGDDGQTITLNCNLNLPFTLSADPTNEATANYYLMTLRERYAHGNSATSKSASDATDEFTDEYLWAFGGGIINGITVYNKNRGYMSVADANNSRATFSTTTPTFFTIKPNSNQTNGFNLNLPGTNTYINWRDDAYVSTWSDAGGNGDVGSCLKTYTENEVVATLLPALQPYFTYAGCVNALTASAAAGLNPTYTSFTQTPPRVSGYIALKDAIDNNLVELSEGYYIVYSGFDEFTTPKGFTTPKAMYYNTSNNKIAWTTADGSAAQVMKLKAVSGTSNYRIYSPLTDKYLQTKVGATTDAEESGLTLTVTPVSVGKVVLVYNANGGDDTALHTEGHNNGSGTSGNLRGWNITSAASLWRLYPIDIPEITLINPNEVATGDQVFQSFAYGSNKQLPLNVAVHYISANNGNFAHIETVNSSAIRANEGYIICGVKGATIPLLPIGEVDALSPSNLLVGVVESTIVYSGHMLAYKKGDSEPKFYKIKSTGLTMANRSYLPAAAAANVRGLELLFGGFGDDEITGIDGINAGSTEGAIFDLQGRRVTKVEKGGIYIINGKKVMK